MNDHRPTRRPCSADSSRKLGPAPAQRRSLRKAETGVWVSSMNTSATGRWPAPLAAAAIEHPADRRQPKVAGAQQDKQVVEEVGRLLGDPLRALPLLGDANLIGLLHDLGAGKGGVGK